MVFLRSKTSVNECGMFKNCLFVDRSSLDGRELSLERDVCFWFSEASVTFSHDATPRPGLQSPEAFKTFQAFLTSVVLLAHCIFSSSRALEDCLDPGRVDVGSRR